MLQITAECVARKATFNDFAYLRGMLTDLLKIHCRFRSQMCLSSCSYLRTSFVSFITVRSNCVDPLSACYPFDTFFFLSNESHWFNFPVWLKESLALMLLHTMLLSLYGRYNALIVHIYDTDVNLSVQRNPLCSKSRWSVKVWESMVMLEILYNSFRDPRESAFAYLNINR